MRFWPSVSPPFLTLDIGRTTNGVFRFPSPTYSPGDDLVWNLSPSIFWPGVSGFDFIPSRYLLHWFRLWFVELIVLMSIWGEVCWCFTFSQFLVTCPFHLVQWVVVETLQTVMLDADGWEIHIPLDVPLPSFLECQTIHVNRIANEFQLMSCGSSLFICKPIERFFFVAPRPAIKGQESIWH